MGSHNARQSALHSFRLFIKYFQLTLKVTLQYKFDRTMIAAAVLIREMAGVIILILMLNRFVTIKGWDINQILFLYSFLFLSYSLFVFSLLESGISRIWFIRESLTGYWYGLLVFCFKSWHLRWITRRLSDMGFWVSFC